MTESEFFLQLSQSKASNPDVIHNFKGLDEVANCIVAVANNNPSANFIVQGSDLENGYIRDKIKSEILNPESVMREAIRLSRGGVIRFCPINGSLSGTGYGLWDEQSILGGFYVAFTKDDNEVDYAIEKAKTRCRLPECSASAIIITR